MLSILGQTLRLAAARWPVLLAWYLAGWLGRYLAIELAATLGATNALLGLLVMPLAILARLASFIGMFLVLRDSMPAFSDLKRSGLDDVDRTQPRGARAAQVYDIFLVSIVPFFAFYAAWKFLGEDTVAYAISSLAKIDVFDEDYTPGGRVLDVQVNWASITAIIVAFAARYLIKRYQAKLPKWTPIVSVYLEAVWVYLTVFLISTYFAQFDAWVANRAAMHWMADLRGSVGDVFAPIGVAWDAIAWGIGEAGALVLLPVAWLALAGIVYGRALTAGPLGLRVPTNRYADRVRTRYARVPKAVSRRFMDVGAGFVGRWKPLANALTLVWRAGVVPMGIFVLAYTVIEASGAWLGFGATRLIGAHDLESWWMNVDGALIFGLDVLLEPLRICLIAAGYDYCLRRLSERRDAAAVADPVPA